MIPEAVQVTIFLKKHSVRGLETKKLPLIWTFGLFYNFLNFRNPKIAFRV